MPEPVASSASGTAAASAADPKAVARERRNRIAGRIAISTVTVCVAVGLWLGFPRSRQPFDDYVAELRRDGDPVTCEELWGPRPPDALNAAAGIEDAIADLDVSHGPRSTWTVPGPWGPRAKSPDWLNGLGVDGVLRLRAHLESLGKFYAQIDEALTRPRFFLRRADVRLLDVKDLPPSLPGCPGAVALEDDAAAMLDARALVAADRRDRVDACRAMLSIASHIEVGTFSEAMTACTIRSRAINRLSVLLRITGGWEAASAARADLDPLLAHGGASQVRCGIQALAVETVEWYGRSLASDRSDYLNRAIARGFGFLTRVTGLPWDPGDSPDAATEVATTCRTLREVARIPLFPYASSSQRHAALLAENHARNNMILYLVPRVIRQLRETEAEARLVRVGLALAEFRAMHDDYPASLDDLRPTFPDGVPLDPFTEAPFSYVRTATGMRLSSPGTLPGEKPLPDDEHGTREIAWELPR